MRQRQIDRLVAKANDMPTSRALIGFEADALGVEADERRGFQLSSPARELPSVRIAEYPALLQGGCGEAAPAAAARFPPLLASLEPEALVEGALARRVGWAIGKLIERHGKGHVALHRDNSRPFGSQSSTFSGLADAPGDLARMRDHPVERAVLFDPLSQRSSGRPCRPGNVVDRVADQRQ